jgi:hypothetical protein
LKTMSKQHPVENIPYTLIDTAIIDSLSPRYSKTLIFTIQPNFGYNLRMTTLTITPRRRPPTSCGLTTNWRLSLLGFRDDSSSIESSPERTNIRLTDI